MKNEINTKTASIRVLNLNNPDNTVSEKFM